MTITIPVVAVAGLLVFAAYRYSGLRAWHAVVSLIFGFLLSATTAAPQIRNLLAALVHWLQRP